MAEHAPGRRRKDLIEPQDLRYIQSLGSGSFGTVRRSYLYKKEVAVKYLTPIHLRTPSDSHLEDKYEELQKLRHPNVAQVLGHGTTCTGSPFIVSELAEHGSLDGFLRTNPALQKDPNYARRRKFDVALDIAQGLLYLHSYDPIVVHLDLKPQNILVCTGEVAKVTDFGLSKILDKDILTAGLPTGNLLYAAPECFDRQPPNPQEAGAQQQAAQEEVEQRLKARDVFSFGLLLHYLFTSENPYSRLHDEWRSEMMDMGACPAALNFWMFRAAHKDMEVPLLDHVLPGGIKDLIRECCAVLPADRLTFDLIVERLRVLQDLAGDPPAEHVPPAPAAGVGEAQLPVAAGPAPQAAAAGPAPQAAAAGPAPQAAAAGSAPQAAALGSSASPVMFSPFAGSQPAGVEPIPRLPLSVTLEIRAAMGGGPPESSMPLSWVLQQLGGLSSSYPSARWLQALLHAKHSEQAPDSAAPADVPVGQPMFSERQLQVLIAPMFEGWAEQEISSLDLIALRVETIDWLMLGYALAEHVTEQGQVWAVCGSLETALKGSLSAAHVDEKERELVLGAVEACCRAGRVRMLDVVNRLKAATRGQRGVKRAGDVLGPQRGRDLSEGQCLGCEAISGMLMLQREAWWVQQWLAAEPELEFLAQQKELMGPRYPEAMFLDPVMVDEVTKQRMLNVMKRFWVLWDDITNHLDRGFIDEAFFRRDVRWAGRGKMYRELLEPIDIANWYMKNKHVHYTRESTDPHRNIGYHYADGIRSGEHDLNGRRPSRYVLLQRIEKAVFGKVQVSTLQVAENMKARFRNSRWEDCDGAQGGARVPTA